MVKAKKLASVLLALALIGSSAAAAYAGGGGQGSSLSVQLLHCYFLNGADSPYVLTLTDQFGTHQHVQLGRARLLCTPTSLDAAGAPEATVEHGPVLNGNFDPGSADHLKCYDAPPFLAGPSAVVTLEDPFGFETIALRPAFDRLAVVCAPAIKTVQPSAP
ncbi:MAG: hypothetical protein DMD87_04910 [Candidatus Rokuibacteriota bacterium]|nr:MAG: hypothetical protein DMD87_04910 [Candidatus Rokubacteria bacterium]